MTATVEQPSDTRLAVSLTGISKSYKHFQLKDVDLQLETGTVMGLIGPNGAGKSTVMRIMMGLVAPQRGTASVLGQDVFAHPASVKCNVGYFADDMRMYKPESIGWHMQFVRSLYNSWDENYARSLLDRFGLIEHQIVKGLSHGQRVKAMLLLILARKPKLLILDEPTNGLDPVARHEVLAELMRVVEEEDRTILYSSHNTQDVEQISDTITFIDRGQVIASQNRDDYLQQWRRIKLRVGEDWQLPPLDGLALDSTFRQLRVLSHDRFSAKVPELLQNSGAEIEAIEPMTLEEIFVSSVLRGRKETRS